MTEISSPPRTDEAHQFETLEARLAASRAAIRSRLEPPSEPDTTGSGRHTEAPGRRPSAKSSWSSLFFDLVAPTAKETAGKHPWGLLAGSAAVGAYLAWTRPWRGVGGVVGPMLVGAVLRNVSSGKLSAGSVMNYFSKRNAAQSPRRGASVRPVQQDIQ